MSNELFLEPKTTQYGSHMVMTNVSKPLKTKYININTKFGDDYDYTQDSNYNITLPEKITNVTSMRVVSAEIPMSYYNISQALGNNYFYIMEVLEGRNNITVKVSIPDGSYSIDNLILAINNNLKANKKFGVSNPTENYIGSSLTIEQVTTTSTTRFKFATSSLATIIINFSGLADLSGNLTSTSVSFSKFNFNYNLGWLLGFRKNVYTINPTANSYLTAEALTDIYGPKYLYLAIEEFNKGNQSSFVTPLYKSVLNKNIIARITLNRNGGYGYGTVLPANNFNGLLMSDTRSYTGKIDLMKLNTQLLTENGRVLNLNGIDYSFCLEVTHE